MDKFVTRTPRNQTTDKDAGDQKFDSVTASDQKQFKVCLHCTAVILFEKYRCLMKNGPLELGLGPRLPADPNEFKGIQQ